MIYLTQFIENAQNFLMKINAWLSPAGCLLTAAFVLSLLVIKKLAFPKKGKITVTEPVSLSTPLDAIAGEDVWTAQLDLARAFFEIGKLHEARDILDQVTQRGTVTQRQEALKLLAKCS